MDEPEVVEKKPKGTKRCKECGFRRRGAGHDDGPHHAQHRHKVLTQTAPRPQAQSTKKAKKAE